MGIDAHRRNASFRHIYYDVSQVFICSFLWYHGAGLGWFGRIWVSTFGRFGSPGRRMSRPVWKVRVCMLDPATSFRKRRDQTTLLWTLRDLARCVGSGLGCVREVSTSIYVTGMSMDMSMIAHMSSRFLLRAVRSSAASLQVRMSLCRWISIRQELRTAALHGPADALPAGAADGPFDQCRPGRVVGSLARVTPLQSPPSAGLPQRARLQEAVARFTASVVAHLANTQPARGAVISPGSRGLCNRADTALLHVDEPVGWCCRWAGGAKGVCRRIGLRVVSTHRLESASGISYTPLIQGGEPCEHN